MPQSKIVLVNLFLNFVLFNSITFTGCTNETLKNIQEKNRLTIEGHYCTIDPTVYFSLKILFVVQASQNIDLKAAQQLIEHYHKQASVSFGLVRLSQNEPQTCTYPSGGCAYRVAAASPFTQDKTLLNTAIVAASQLVNSARPYKDTLGYVHDIIEQDIAYDINRAASSKYIVLFLTNGAPCPAESKENIIAQVDKLKKLENGKAGEVVFHTVLSEYDSSKCGNDYSAVELLNQMAVTTDGIMQMIDHAKEADFRPIVQKELENTFELVKVIAENRNARMGLATRGFLSFPDSDGDGLPDYLEQQIGSSPLSIDTDGDGCSDTFEYLRPGYDLLNPGEEADQPHCSCPESKRKLDSDQDGALDCEEFYLGTSPNSVDTDGDGLPDGMELRFGIDPARSHSGFFDSDDDGVSDIDEIVKHRLPWKNEQKHAPDDAFIYDYKYQIEPEGTLVDGVQCYRIKVANISLVETLDHSHGINSHQQGENTIELTFIEQSRERPKSPKIIRVGTVKQLFFNPDIFVPNRSTIEIFPTDLEIRK